MLVRALQTFASPVASLAVGQEGDVPDDVGAEWVRLGLVQRVGASVERAVKGKSETAVKVGR